MGVHAGWVGRQGQGKVGGGGHIYTCIYIMVCRCAGGAEERAGACRSIDYVLPKSLAKKGRDEAGDEGTQV